jgi:amino acid adenylation domain-containing protein
MNGELQAALAARIDPQPSMLELQERSRDLSIFPLSFGEERLWFLDRLQSAPVYNMLSATRLSGELDAGALAAALERIVERHEILRTTFPTIEGSPVQLVQSKGGVRLEEEVSEGAGWRQKIEEQVQERFDLERGPLARARLLRLGSQEHVLALSMHHIISDQWSMGVLLREMVAGYEALVEGKPWPLEELPIQYGDYACWQRERLQGARLEGELHYWSKQLGGMSELLELPWERPRPRVQSFRGGRLGVEIPAEVVKGLRGLGQRIGATLYMTVLASWQALLCRYSNQEDIAVGTPTANRTRVELEGLIGFFVNTLVMRTDLSGNPRFLELLERVQQVCMGAYAHQEVPFERVVEQLRPARSLGHTPLFQVMLAMQSLPPGRTHAGGLRLSAVEVEREAVPFDVLLSLSEMGDGGLAGILGYSRDVFSEAGMKRLLGHWMHLLQQIVERPEERIWDLRWMTEKQQQRVVGRGVGQKRERSWTDWVREFEKQVASHPAAVALEAGGSQHQYGDLNEQANRIGRWLVSHGVGPESVVGLALERSPELVMAWLGTWKARAAAAPLDPAWPEERLRWILKETQTQVVVSRRGLNIHWPAELKILWLDDDVNLLASYPSHNLDLPFQPNQLAYILYTSGSSGRPKGVMIDHAAFAHYMHWCLEAYDLSQGSGVVLHSPITFDLAITSIFPPLLVGQPIYIVPKEDEIEVLSNILRARKNLTLLKLTPAHLEMLQAILTSSEIRECTRGLIVGGESLFYETVSVWRRNAPGTRIYNEYGPTETTVGCCVFEVRTSQETGPVPIGYPITNTNLYILDRQLRPCPLGVFGELYIGGQGVGRGYNHAADLTAAQFVPDPYSQEAGSRLYASGDIARLLSNGSIEYLGRRDKQVKVRGFRIELNEVEQHFLRCEGVLGAVAVVREDMPLQKSLVVYVVLGQAAPVIEKLLERVRNELPEYLVPTAVVQIEAIPISANGKIDHRQLPPPQTARVRQRVLASTDLETSIALVWKEVLGVDEVGVDETFFELGGNSLLLAKVHAKLRESFGAKLLLTHLFQYSTIASLGRWLADEAIPKQQSPTENRAQKQIKAISARKTILTRKQSK